MESSTAGYVGAGPLLADSMRTLAALRPEVPVLSLYLNLDPREFGVQAARRSAYTSLLDEARRRVEAYETDHDGRVSLRGDLERASAFFDAYRPERGRGVAIFAASAAGLFEAITLPRAPSTRVVIDDSPYVTPLVQAADRRDWLIAVVDARSARLLHGNPDRLVEIERIDDHLAGQHERQSTTDHQRWVERQVDEHVKRVAAEVQRRMRDGRYERLLVGGPSEVGRRLEEQLGNPVRERIAGRFAVEVPDSSTDDIRAAVAGCFEDDERRRERELLDRLRERIGRGDRAVAGIADVLVMLEMARVETLLYGERYEPPDPAVLEKAIEDAIAQSAEVVALRHHPDDLAPLGDVAAILRF